MRLFPVDLQNFKGCVNARVGPAVTNRTTPDLSEPRTGLWHKRGGYRFVVDQPEARTVSIEGSIFGFLFIQRPHSAMVTKMMVTNSPHPR